jgi:cation diffusion facilitator CzcD-associated flavoprotein CzcO
MSGARFAIIGGGMAGILAAIKLRGAGFHDFTIYEKAEGLGGTWRANTYPGVACDVPSHLYSYSFAPNAQWSHRYAPGREILAYFEQVAAAHEVHERVRFGEEVVRLEREGGRWQLQTSRGTRDSADFVLLATGVLHHPKLPKIEGLEAFAGRSFHSSAWDHAAKVDGARVGVIGSGSSGVQIVSALASRVGKLALFQRTPQWIMPQENVAYTDAERESYRDAGVVQALRADLSRRFAMGYSNAVVDPDSPEMAVIEAVCLKNLEQSVPDPLLREKLRPNYRAACKRLVVSPDFYRAIQHPSAELVTEAVACVEPRGVRTRDGRLHELDTLVLATGFHADQFMRPMEIVGRAGVRLSEAWAERPVAYLSISVPGFPNLFLINGPNGPVGNFSLIDVAEMQLDYIQQLCARVLDGGCREICATAEATARFDRDRTEAARKTVFNTGCQSWYLDDRGIPAVWPWTFERFRDEMRAPRLDCFEER